MIKDEDRKRLHEALKPVLRDGAPCVVTVTVKTAPEPPNNLRHYTLVAGLSPADVDLTFKHCHEQAKKLISSAIAAAPAKTPADGGPGRARVDLICTYDCVTG